MENFWSINQLFRYLNINIDWSCVSVLNDWTLSTLSTMFCSVTCDWTWCSLTRSVTLRCQINWKQSFCFLCSGRHSKSVSIETRLSCAVSIFCLLFPVWWLAADIYWWHHLHQWAAGTPADMKHVSCLFLLFAAHVVIDEHCSPPWRHIHPLVVMVTAFR